jgi:hypothetical protein
MMGHKGNFDVLISELFVIDSLDNFSSGKGGSFIGHLKKRGAIAFVHSLYPTRELDKNAIVDLLGFSPPAFYMEFMGRHDGASLYCGLVLLYSVHVNDSRSLKLDDQSAPSLFSEADEFRSRCSSAWNIGWRPIGCIISNKIYDICIDKDGQVGVFRESVLGIEFECLLGLFRWAKARFSALIDSDGIIDDTYVSVDKIIDSDFDRLGSVH